MQNFDKFFFVFVVSFVFDFEAKNNKNLIPASVVCNILAKSQKGLKCIRIISI